MTASGIHALQYGQAVFECLAMQCHVASVDTQLQQPDGSQGKA